VPESPRYPNAYPSRLPHDSGARRHVARHPRDSHACVARLHQYALRKRAPTTRIGPRRCRRPGSGVRRNHQHARSAGDIARARSSRPAGISCGGATSASHPARLVHDHVAVPRRESARKHAPRMGHSFAACRRTGVSSTSGQDRPCHGGCDTAISARRSGVSLRRSRTSIARWSPDVRAVGDRQRHLCGAHFFNALREFGRVDSHYSRQRRHDRGQNARRFRVRRDTCD